MGVGHTCALLLFALLLGRLRGLLEEDPGGPAEDRDLGKAILEMLHINKLSAPHRTKPHPYMKQVYLFLDSQEARDLAGSDGTLVQSFRSIQGWKYGTPGWIWFNVSLLKPSMAIAELVLLRKTLHPEPLSVSVAVHSIFPQAGNLTISEPLEEKLLTLDKLPPSGYDVFNVSSVLSRQVDGGAVGFQLRYTDESGSLVLHEALTQSLYCLNSSSQSEPLLVVYQVELSHLHAAPHSPERRQRQHCGAGRKRHLLPTPPAGRESQCSLHQRYVNFHVGHLADWILEPVGFNSSFCRGTCSHGKTIESTKGGRLKDRHSGDQSGSDCFPQELSPLTVMYRSETDDIIIEKLKNMRAESCVCRRKDPQ